VRVSYPAFRDARQVLEGRDSVAAPEPRIAGPRLTLCRTYGETLPMVEFDVAPERTALLNIDMQNYFIDLAADGHMTLERVNHLTHVCRDAGILVIHTRHVLRPDGSNVGLLGEFVPPIRDGALDEGSASAALHDNLVVDPRDALVTKPRFGAFYGTDLDVILRSRGIDSIIISGIATNVCCDTTAREANARDIRVFFLSDGTTTAGRGGDPAEAQQRTLELVGALFAEVLTVEEMVTKINKAVQAVS
jgi:nicotinamidase-related amidase